MFADVSDIEARWRPLTTDEAKRADVLLGDASAMLEALVDVDPCDCTQESLLRSVCASMVIRAMSAAESDNFGVSQASVTAGPYTPSWTYSNTSGDLFLTRNEKRLLGIGSGRIGWAPLGGSDD